MNLTKYLLSKGITDGNILIKQAEIYVLLAISASDPSCSNLKDGLKMQWGKITDGHVSNEDIAFIDDSAWENYPFQLFMRVKGQGLSLVSKDDALNYLRIVWFFTFMAKNHRNVGGEDFAAIVRTAKRKEIECGYFVPLSNGNHYIDSLKYRYINPKTPTELRLQLWTQVGQRYLRDLEWIFDEAKELLLARGNESEFSNWFKIFTLVPLDKLPPKSPRPVIEKKKKTNIEKRTTAVRIPNSAPVLDSPPKGDKKDDIDSQQTRSDELESEQPAASVSPNTQEPIDNEALTPNSKEENEKACQVPQAENAPDKEEEIRKLVVHQEIKQKENVSETFEESLNKIYDLSRCISEFFRLEGIEALIITLNSSAYGNLLDKVYFAVQNKSQETNDFTSAAILIKNALQEHGFAFEFYPKEPLDTCIGAPSDDDLEYISRNYRWKSDAILYRNLYIRAPGIMNRKTKTFVYPPLVEVMEHE